MALQLKNSKDNAHGRTRHLSFITFLLCCMMISSILIYTDSSSIYIWNKETEVGPASFVISGDSVQEYIDDFRGVPGIIVAETIELCWCELLAYIIPPVNNSQQEYALSGNQEDHDYNPLGGYEMPPIDTPATAAYLSPSFSTSFPDLYPVIEGRLPENDSEIAVSGWLAARFLATPGTKVNYTRGFSLISSNVTIVGIFSLPKTNNSLEVHYVRTDVIVTSGLFGDRGYDSHIYADIDRSIISPQNPLGAMSYLANLDDRLRMVDPEFKVTKQWTMFFVDDLLVQGISSYLTWLNNVRASQMLRSSGFIFLGFIVSSVGVNFSTRTKKMESELLRARGASSKRIIIAEYREVFVMTTIAIPIGIFGSYIISRLGLLSVSFFSIDFSKGFQSPFLLSAETIVVTTLLTYVVPVLLVVNHSTTERIRSSSFVQGSRLAKYTGKMHSIRWELIALLTSVALMGSIIQQGISATQNPNIKVMLILIPIVLALSITSMTIKGIKQLLLVITRILHGILNGIPSSIGIRRIGKHTRFAGPSIMVFVLAVSLTWSAIITNYTIPTTTQGHTRFAIGGDVAFKLDSTDTSHWDEFTQNITSHELVESATQVLVRTLYMTASTSSAIDFTSINPSKFLEVGFDSVGSPLENSPLRSYLKLMEVSPSGIVITRDLSVLYSLQMGDTLHAYTRNSTDFIPYQFMIIGIVDCLPDTLVTESGYHLMAGENIGLWKVWANSEYIEPLLSEETIAEAFLCIRMIDPARSEELVESILETGGLTAIDGLGIATMYSELYTTINDAMFVVERAVDTMLVIISMLAIITIVFIYSSETKNECKRQNAVLSTLGADLSIFRTVNIAEMLGTVLVSLIVLLFVSPFFIISSVMVYLVDFGARLFLFPSPILFSVPWLILLSVIVALTIVIALLSFVNVNIELKQDELPDLFRSPSYTSAEWRDR